jgi:hypothetical protein
MRILQCGERRAHESWKGEIVEISWQDEVERDQSVIVACNPRMLYLEDLRVIENDSNNHESDLKDSIRSSDWHHHYWQWPGHVLKVSVTYYMKSCPPASPSLIATGTGTYVYSGCTVTTGTGTGTASRYIERYLFLVTLVYCNGALHS